MTAEDVFRVLLDERSDIGLATVYRVLTQFEQAGILSRSHFESGKAVYELNEGSTTTTWSAWTAARWRSSTTPRSKSASAVAKAKGLGDAGPRAEPVRQLHQGGLPEPPHRAGP
jgi:Fur family ferric uptake transcriptional regulator